MAVVGDAFVRVRVISSGLSNDIADSVRNGFRNAGPDIDREGAAAGTRAGKAAGEGLRNETRAGARRAGSEAADDLETNLRTRLVRNIRQKFGTSLRNSLRDSFKRGIAGLTPEGDFDFKAFSRAGQDLSKSLHEGFSLGIGRARMGKSVLSALLLAAPSLLSGAAAIGGAMAAELVTFISAIGPGIAGTLGIAAAGISTLALNAGLLFAAFKAGNPQLDAAKEKLKTFATQLGTPIAAGMAAGFTSFADHALEVLPEINDLLGETGEAFGNVAKTIGETLVAGQNIDRLKGILATNKTFVDNFGIGLNGLTTSFLILFNAAKPFVDYIGQAAAVFGDWAANTLTVAEANGSLATFMENLYQKFRQLMSIIGDFGVGIYNVFKSASDTGEGLLQRIQAIGEKFRAWTGDSANQERMSKFFEKMDILAHAVFETISSLFGAAGTGLENMNLQPILDFLTTIQTVVGPAIAAIFKEIKEGAGANLAEAFTNLGTALQKVADSGMVQKIADAVSSLVLAASEFINTDFGNFIFSIMVPLGLFGGLLSTLIGPISALFSVISTLATAGLLPLAATIGAIVGAFVLMYTNSQNLRDALGNLGGIIQEHLVAVFERLKPLIGPLITAVQELATALGDKLAGAINFLAPIIGVVIDKLGVIFEYILKQATTFIELITALLTGDWSRAWDLALEAVQNVWELLQGLFGDIVSAVGEQLGKIPELLGSVWESVENKAVEVWDGILNWLKGIWDGIYQGASDWINNMTSGISEGFSSIGDTISTAWGNVTGFFSDLWNGIVEGVSGFWNGMVSAFQTGWAHLIAFITGFGQGLMVVWNMIWNIAAVPVKILWNLIMLVWDNIKGYLEEVWNGIAALAATIWSGITSFFSTVWDGVKTAAETAWNAITSFLTTIWDFISNTANTVWTAISSFFSTIWEAVSSTFQTVWAAITEYLTTAWNGIVAVATTIWTGIVTFFATIWEGVSTAAVAVWTTITEFLSTAWTNILAVATTIWTAVWEFLSTIWTGISTTVQTVVTAIGSFLASAWAGIQSVVSSVWSAISGFFSTIWNAIWSTISTAANNIMTFLQGVWNTITSAVSSAWGAISGLASTLWGNVVSTIEDVVGPIVGTLQGWWDDITSAISSAWDGLAGTVGAIWEDVKNAIVGPIEDAWKSLTGWATSIGEVISGILGDVTSAVDDVNTKIASMLEASNATDIQANGVSLFAAAQGGGAAEGAIVPPIPGGWNMIVGEGGQTERIEPLDRQGLSQRDRALIAHLVGSMAGAAPAGGGQIAVNVNLDGNLLGRFIESIVVDQQSQAGRRAARNRRI